MYTFLPEPTKFKTDFFPNKKDAARRDVTQFSPTYQEQPRTGVGTRHTPSPTELSHQSFS